MIKSIYKTAQNMYAKENNLEIVANNVSNVNTSGFKRELPFSEIMSRYQNTPVKQITDTQQGNYTQTSNPLDLTVSGNSYFLVNTPEGQQVSKNGRFRISEDGFLVNEQGYHVMGRKGDINFHEAGVDQEQSVNISKSGEIRLGETYVGELQIVKVDNPSVLERKEGANFISTDSSYRAADPEEYSVLQGYLEDSNVNPVLELQSMIDISKEFESSQKVINVLDHSLEQANSIGKV
ncbi:MAG: flagellar hook-basal body protein [Bacteroidota bacterium]